MERLDLAHPRFARDRAGGGGRQMRALGSQRYVRLCENGLDEQQVGILDEPDDGPAIGGRVSDVGHVADFLAWRDRYGGTQLSERRRRSFFAAS